MAEAKIGVIGGSGLYQIEGMQDVQELRIPTPFGDPSDAVILGSLDGIRMAFLPRHSRGHRIMPTEIPVKANIYALKSIGVEHVISVSAVGSLREEIAPLDLVIPDQIIDRTTRRSNTFFGNGVVAHVGFADPFCPDLRDTLYEAAKQVDIKVHRGGTYIAMEGPAFSTKAESNLYRSWGASIIGMTAIPEAKLAREAELCYATLAFVTDYDCWHPAHETVTIEMILMNLLRNVDNAKKIIKLAASHVLETETCACANALQNAIVTTPELIPSKVKEDLRPIIGKYVK